MLVECVDVSCVVEVVCGEMLLYGGDYCIDVCVVVVGYQWIVIGCVVCVGCVDQCVVVCDVGFVLCVEVVVDQVGVDG